MEESTNIHCKANASTSSKSELIINIEEMLRILEPFTSSKHCIYRVPDQLRKLNQEAYTPQVISLGPYHHGKERYGSMEKLKVECLENFRRRTKSTIEDLVNIIMKQEESIRDCYAENIKFGRNDFVKIILVDASFIVEFLTISGSIGLLDPWLRDTMLRDLLLLENQVPLFIIEELFNLVHASCGQSLSSHINLCLNWLGPDNIKILSTTPNLQMKHFLDLLRTSLLPQSQRLGEENDDQGKKSCRRILKPIGKVKLCSNKLRTCLGLQKRSNEEDKHLKKGTQLHKADNGNDQAESLPDTVKSESRNQLHHESQNLPSVTQLHRAGVKFEVSSSKCLLKLEFIKGVLKIPKLRMTDATEPFFRNIVAFEQRHYLRDAYVTNYTSLLDSLINTTEDVDLLVEKGIIVNWIGDNNAVTTLVNNLGRNILWSKETPDYYELSQQLKAFHNNRCHRWRAILVRDYFSTPWRIASTSAAVILLVLTFIQTVCSLIR